MSSGRNKLVYGVLCGWAVVAIVLAMTGSELRTGWNDFRGRHGAGDPNAWSIAAIDAYYSKVLPSEGNIYLSFDDLRTASGGAFVYTTVSRVSYLVHPRRVYCMNDPAAPYSGIEDLLAFNAPPDPEVLRAWGVRTILFYKLVNGQPKIIMESLEPLGASARGESTGQ